MTGVGETVFQFKGQTTYEAEGGRLRDDGSFVLVLLSALAPELSHGRGAPKVP